MIFPPWHTTTKPIKISVISRLIWKKMIAFFFSFQEVSNVLQYDTGAKLNWMKKYWMTKLRFSFFLKQTIFTRLTRDLPASQAVCIAIMDCIDYLYIEVSMIGPRDAPQTQCTGSVYWFDLDISLAVLLCLFRFSCFETGFEIKWRW